MTIPVVEAGRVRLTPFAERHLTPEYVSWLNDGELMRHSEQRHRRHTLESCRAYWESFQGTPHRFWAVEALDMDGLHIGNLNAYVDERNGLADMGVLIGHRAARRKGYGQEAWNAALFHLLSQPGMRKVTAGMMALNAGMLSVAQRSGMVRDGRRARHLLCDGAEVDVCYWAAFSGATPPGLGHGAPAPGVRVAPAPDRDAPVPSA